jgi:ADP-ribosylglycohydrolase
VIASQPDLEDLTVGLELSERCRGLLLGTAAGDAVGLPREGLSRKRALRMFGGPPLRHQFLFGGGMVSDDTEHACMTAQALLISAGDPDRFGRVLAWRLRLWLLGMPAAVGSATLRAMLKLWLGFSPAHSGVFSAGNGPLMRAPLLGLCVADPKLLPRLIRTSTRLTHTDPRAERGALLVALAVRHAVEQSPGDQFAAAFFERIRQAIPDADPQFSLFLTTVEEHVQKGATAEECAAALGLQHGVTGYVYHTAFAAVFCWLRWPNDFRRAVEEVICLGGDTDTTGAVVGGIMGAAVGEAGIPPEWVNGLAEWPCSTGWMRSLADRLSKPGSRPLAFFWPLLPLRNLLFFLVVILHILRRLWPW